MEDDLRSVPADAFWVRFGSMMGADGLLTYRYLGRKTVHLHDVDHDSMRIRRDMRDTAGGIMAAPLAIASAEAGGFTDIESIPAPITAALHVLDDGHDVREILIRRSTIHTGRTMGFSQSEIVDAAQPSRILALSYGSGIRLGTAPPGFKPIETGPEIEDSSSLPPLHQAFGAHRRTDGVWELPAMNAASMSTSGSLHLGPIHVVLEAAATELASGQAGGDHIRIEDWTVMFVARGTHGPFIVGGDAAKGGNGRIACRLSLRDQGRDNRIVASAVGIFRPARR